MSIASEITSIGENLKKDYQAIANLGADLTNVDKNIENIAELLDGVYDVLPKTSFQTGTSVTIENGLKGKLDFDEDNGKKVVGIGQTEQDGTPTPSTPITINSVTGNQDVVVRGKNLLDISQTPIKRNNDTQYSIIGDDIEIKTETVTNAGIMYQLEVKVGKDITISYEDMVEISTSSNNVVTYGFSDTLLSSWTQGAVINRTQKTATANATAKYMYIAMRTGGNSGYSLKKLQVEYGSSATPYEPYITPTSYQLSLGDKKLYDECYISKEGNGWYFNDSYIRYIGKLNYSSFNSEYNRLQATYSIASPATYNTSSNFLCNITKMVGGSVNKTNPNASMQLRGGSGTNTCYIWLDNITTSEQAQTFLTNTDFDIVSATDTPIKTPITDTTLINQLENWYNAKSLNGTTIITSNGNLPMIIKVRGLKGE